VHEHGCQTEGEGSVCPPVELGEPEIRLPEEEGEDLYVMPRVGRRPTIEHTEGGGVGCEHLLLR